MKDIICDTMIWYELGKGKLEIPDKNKFNLVCTYLSLTELAFSKNVFSKLELVQNALLKIVELQPTIINLHPYDYARSLIDKTYSPELEFENEITLKSLQNILNYSKNNLANNQFATIHREIIDRRETNHSKWSEYINNLNNHDNQFRRIMKRHPNEELFKTMFQDWFILQLNQSSEVKYSFDLINWTYFEFYEAMFKSYNRNLFLTKMKSDKNDEKDLNNMIYVQPNSLYWTLEKRLIKIAKEAKAESYLYTTEITN
jgi:hypothetical protein